MRTGFTLVRPKVVLHWGDIVGCLYISRLAMDIDTPEMTMQ